MATLKRRGMAGFVIGAALACSADSPEGWPAANAGDGSGGRQ